MDTSDNDEATRQDTPNPDNQNPVHAPVADSPTVCAVRRGKPGNKGSAKTYSYADIQKLKEEWKRIGAGAVLEDTLYAKRAIRIAAKDMADTILDVSMDRSEYVHSLIRGGFHRSTAFEIVKLAFAMAAERHEIAMRKIPDSAPKPISTQSRMAGTAESGGVEAKGNTKPAPVQSAKPLNGDARESDGWVWDKDLQDYRDPQTLPSGFPRVRDRHVWDRREGKFIDESTLPDGYKRIDDGWEWSSTMHAYRDPKGGKNPYGLNLIENGNAR